jgi:hypothetical protein
MSHLELIHIARTAHAYGLTAKNATKRARAQGIEELARYLASGYAEASDLLAEVVPDLTLTD